MKLGIGMENKLEYRMYGFVPYNISDKQKCIQFGHAVVEYGLKYFKDKNYQKWAKKDKTFIVLDGGTTNNGEEPHKHVIRNESYVGTLQKHHLELKKNKIKVATFFEPDLNDTLTAVVFLVDERVFNRIKYPDYINHELEYKMKHGIIGLSAGDNDDFEYNLWIKGIGGEQNAFLRTFLKNFKLA